MNNFTLKDLKTSLTESENQIYIAQQLDPSEQIELLNISELEEMFPSLIIRETREYPGLNSKIISKIEDASYDAYRYLESEATQIAEDWNSMNFDDIPDETFYDILDELEFFDEENCEKDIKKWRDLFKQKNTDYESLEFILDVLSLKNGVKYTSSKIRGMAQGEVAEVIYPIDTPRKTISALEAYYFGTGSEWELDGGIYYLTDEYSDDDILDTLSKNSGIPKDQIKLEFFNFNN